MWAHLHTCLTQRCRKMQLETERTHPNNFDRSHLQRLVLTCWNGISGDSSGSVWPRWALLPPGLGSSTSSVRRCQRSSSAARPTSTIARESLFWLMTKRSWPSRAQCPSLRFFSPARSSQLRKLCFCRAKDWRFPRNNQRQKRTAFPRELGWSFATNLCILQWKSTHKNCPYKRTHSCGGRGRGCWQPYISPTSIDVNKSSHVGT